MLDPIAFVAVYPEEISISHGLAFGLLPRLARTGDQRRSSAGSRLVINPEELNEIFQVRHSLHP